MSFVVLALVAPIARSVRFRLAHDDWIKDRTIPFGLAKLWSMSYLGPVRVDPIDRLKTIFPEDVSGNITWTCLANPAAFPVLNDCLLGSRR